MRPVELAEISLDREKSHSSRLALFSKFLSLTLIGSLMSKNANSPRLPRSVLDTDQILRSSVWVTAFSLDDNWHF